MKNKNIITLGIVVLIIISLIYYLESSKISPIDFKISELQELKQGIYPKAPELAGISGYLNTDNINISSLKGKVVLIDFWTYTCINCIRTLPYLTDWDQKYKDKGLVIIGVHTPEFEFEKDYNNVKDAIQRHNIQYPVVQDNDYITWRAYKNRFWPHKYLIDSEGFIRYDHIGEGAYKETEMKIQELLLEMGMEVIDMGTSDIEDKGPTQRTTPELYTGYDFALSRGQDIGNKEGLKAKQTIDYILPDNIKKNIIYLEGKWKSNPDNLQSQGQTSITLNFFARSVNIVSNTLSGPLKLEVFINEEYIKKEQAGTDVIFEDEKAYILIDGPRLYNLFEDNYEDYKLKLKINSTDFTFNAFTFG